VRRLVDATRARTAARYVRALLTPSVAAAATARAVEAAAISRTFDAAGALTLRRWPHDGRLDLRGSEHRVFSQNGEDGVLAAIRDAIEPLHHYFVEFGVQTGQECNTRYLAETLGWSGLYFEPDPCGFAALDRRYVRTPRVRVARTAITPASVNERFAEDGVPERFAVLSIDVDGQDYWIWEQLADRYRPDVVVIEHNGDHPPGRAVVEEIGTPWAWPPGRNWGASLEALRRLGERKGYRLVHVESAGVNAFFVCNDRIPPGLTIDGITDRSPNHSLMGRGQLRFGPDRAFVELGD